jgi:hypothetical protein
MEMFDWLCEEAFALDGAVIRISFCHLDTRRTFIWSGERGARWEMACLEIQTPISAWKLSECFLD